MCKDLIVRIPFCHPGSQNKLFAFYFLEAGAPRAPRSTFRTKIWDRKQDFEGIYCLLNVLIDWNIHNNVLTSPASNKN